MSEWVYKATETKVGFFETLHLATQKHFLCRSVVEEDGKRADRVDELALGDIIHFYFKRKTKPASCYGSFEVVDGSVYPVHFGERIPGTALFKVLETPENADLIRRLTDEHDRDSNKGYQRDPELDVFTGWVIRRLDGSTPPAFDQKKLFPGPMVNLWPYPDASLPRVKATKG